MKIIFQNDEYPHGQSTALYLQGTDHFICGDIEINYLLTVIKSMTDFLSHLRQGPLHLMNQAVALIEGKNRIRKCRNQFRFGFVAVV